MDVDAWLKYLETFPSGLKNKSLDRVMGVARKLDVLSHVGKIVTVAGTNGKSSTVILLESILRTAGYKTAAYISPHLLKYNERIRLNGSCIDDESLCLAFSLVERARGDISLSFFEFSTLASLVVFKQQSPDILILEVGLGGRFDAVNILDNDLSIITTISLDHVDILGKTKEAIGYEKAHVMRPFKPVVCGGSLPASIFAFAKDIQAEPYFLDNDFSYVEREDSWDWCFNEEKSQNLPIPDFPLANAALAIMASKLLAKDFKVFPQDIISGLNRSFLPGRLQKIEFDNKEIILDVAHNFESAAMLATNLARKKPQARILAVVGTLSDKEVASILSPLIKLVDRWYFGEISNNKRSLNAEGLIECARSLRIANSVFFPSITESFREAIAECREKDTIVVFGSFYTVAEVLEFAYKLKNIGE